VQADIASDLKVLQFENQIFRLQAFFGHDIMIDLLRTSYIMQLLLPSAGMRLAIGWAIVKAVNLLK
jgi:hypothetical protein